MSCCLRYLAKLEKTTCRPREADVDGGAEFSAHRNMAPRPLKAQNNRLVPAFACLSRDLGDAELLDFTTPDGYESGRDPIV
jgi:hypothetical protein